VFRDIGSFFTEEPEDSPVTDAFSKAIDNPQDILFHLNVLRKHLLRAIVMLFITTVLSFIFTRQVLELLARPLDGGMDALQAIDVTEPIGVFMRVALLTGFAIALPYITLELWLFAAPGLGRRSRIYGLLAIPAVTLFFLGGMAFAYFVMLPTALPFLVNFMGFQTAPRPSTYFPFVTGLMFWLGVIFEFPLVIYILASIGIIRADTLMKQSRLALVILSIVAAAITPTVDPISMLLVWGPLVLLYFLGVGLAYLAQGRRRVEREDLPRVSASD
jgi:sec-independent protein translocase protein TatC